MSPPAIPSELRLFSLHLGLRGSGNFGGRAECCPALPMVVCPLPQPHRAAATPPAAAGTAAAAAPAAPGLPTADPGNAPPPALPERSQGVWAGLGRAPRAGKGRLPLWEWGRAPMDHVRTKGIRVPLGGPWVLGKECYSGPRSHPIKRIWREVSPQLLSISSPSPKALQWGTSGSA